MIILKGEDEFFVKEGTAVTIGKFDGIHRGHKRLIEDVLGYAKKNGHKSCVVTFTFPEEEGGNTVEGETGRLLLTRDEKLRMIKELGVDIVAEFSFDDKLKGMNPYAFIESILVGKLNMKSVSVGPDFRFGRDREGKVINLHKAAMIYGYNVSVIEKEEYDREKISSTRIRECLAQGEFEKVSDMLGRDYGIAGTVSKGRQLGHKIGVPTMNIYPSPEKLLPPYGTYACKALKAGKVYKAVTNIGVRPTLTGKDNSGEVSIETHILGYSEPATGDYGKEITVFPVKKIRDEKKFASLEELSARIEEDIKEAEEMLVL